MVDQLFSIEISDDRMHAFLKCCKLGGYSDVSPGQIVAVLEAARIEVSDQVAERTLEFAKRIEDQGVIREPFEIATGKEPRDGVDARLEWDQRYEANRRTPWDVQGRPDFYSLRSFVEVQEGEIIGKLIRKEDGEDGHDVLGNSISQGQARELAPGDGVALGEDSQSLLAQRSGKVEISNGEIKIGECRRIEEDVEANTEKIISKIPIHIAGAVRGAPISCESSIVVEQAIEAADLQSGNDIIVGEGITGRNRAKIVAAGNIVARYCESATLEAGGDVQILTSLNHAEVRAMGRVEIAGGVILGGSLYAREGVIAKAVGNDAGVKTLVRVGIHPDVLAAIAEKDNEIRAKEETASRIRETVQPLMAQMKRLTAAQREKATELLAQADEISDEIEQLKAAQQEVLRRSKPDRPPSIEVESKLYEGTVLFFDELEFRVDKELRGPVCIRASHVNGQWAMVATNTFTKTEKVLTSKKLSQCGSRKH